jgi:hypothetical protein
MLTKVPTNEVPTDIGVRDGTFVFGFWECLMKTRPDLDRIESSSNQDSEMEQDSLGLDLDLRSPSLEYVHPAPKGLQVQCFTLAAFDQSGCKSLNC